MKPKKTPADCVIESGDILNCNTDSGRKRRALTFKPWPNGRITYSFDALPDTVAHKSFSISKHEAVHRVVTQFSQFPMLQFVNVPFDEAHLQFHVPKNPTLCSATVGFDVNARVNLGASAFCFSAPTIIHELGHVAGLEHTQNRNDRDKFIRVPTVNNRPFEGNFFFDFQSIMMYSLNTLQATLTSKGRTRLKLQNVEAADVGHAVALSPQDIQTLVFYYGGKGPTEETVTTSYLPLLYVAGGLLVLIVAMYVVHRKTKSQF